MIITVSKPKWLYIDGKGHGLINGKKELSFDLPSQWNFGELEYAYKEACLKYNLEIPDDEEELHRIIRDAVNSYAKREDGKDGGGDESRQETAFNIAQELMTKYNFRTLRDTKEILVYGGGIYKPEQGLIGEEAQSLLGEKATKSVVSEIEGHIERSTFADRAEFDEDPSILNLKNGLLDVRTGQFSEHRPEHLSVSQLPVNYRPSAKCPNFMRFLQETLEREHIGIIVRLLGYLLYKKSIYHKAFMFYGEGSNGKSTLINTIEAFTGKENRSSVSLQDLTTNRFAKAELYDKLVNVFADIPSEEITDTGGFKMLVAGDPIGAERKFQQRFTFANYAKLIFSANVIPKSADKTYAYFRRWILIPFNRVFEGDDADEYLLDKLTTKEELSGILNLAIKGLKKLHAERGFKEQDIEEIIRAYDLGASWIRSFLQEKCIVEPGNDALYEESARLREAYRRFCKAQGRRQFNEAYFGRELKGLGIEHRQKRISSKKVYCDFGIALKGGNQQGQKRFDKR